MIPGRGRSPAVIPSLSRLSRSAAGALWAPLTSRLLHDYSGLDRLTTSDRRRRRRGRDADDAASESQEAAKPGGSLIRPRHLLLVPLLILVVFAATRPSSDGRPASSLGRRKHKGSKHSMDPARKGGCFVPRSPPIGRLAPIAWSRHRNDKDDIREKREQ